MSHICLPLEHCFGELCTSLLTIRKVFCILNYASTNRLLLFSPEEELVAECTSDKETRDNQQITTAKQNNNADKKDSGTSKEQQLGT